MNKQERMNAAREKLADVGEYSPRAARTALMSEFDLTTSEANKVVWEPYRTAYEGQQQARRQRAMGQSCHYCGQPATDIGSYNEPICDGCQ